VIALLLDLRGAEATEFVGSGQYAERAAGFTGIVEMQADGEHLLEVLERWLNMRHAVFEAPGTEAGCVALFSHGDGQILMPGYEPIRFR
jgi:hypothetical protein